MLEAAYYALAGAVTLGIGVIVWNVVLWNVEEWR